MLLAKQIHAFQKEILEWYEKNKRPLPWRETRDPYTILVSEVMSQQTQIGRIVPKYEEWMRRFPTIESLAKASTREVLQYWNGLGYNRRALYLQKLAQVIVKDFSGAFPQDEGILKKLPGIGEYTARALLCFAFNKQIAVIDTNIRKVIAVTFFDGVVPEKKQLEEIATQLLPEGKAYEWNQALMDYASSMLKKHKIPIPKQSKFTDSDRYFRGEIVRILLKEKKITLSGLLEHFQTTKKNLPEERLRQIVEGLEKDGFLRKIKASFTLS